MNFRTLELSVSESNDESPRVWLCLPYRRPYFLEWNLIGSVHVYISGIPFVPSKCRETFGFVASNNAANKGFY
jgi:hypothetical protein